MQLKLEFETEEEYEGYRVELRRKGEEAVLWNPNRSRARSTEWGKTLVVRVPASIFTEGNYRLMLLAMTTEGELEEISHYDFSIVRK